MSQKNHLVHLNCKVIVIRKIRYYEDIITFTIKPMMVVIHRIIKHDAYNSHKMNYLIFFSYDEPHKRRHVDLGQTGDLAWRRILFTMYFI